MSQSDKDEKRTFTIKVRKPVAPAPPVLPPPPDPNTDATCQNLTILEIADRYTPLKWRDFFAFARPELEKVSQILANIEANEGTFYPWKCDVFRAFYLLAPEDIKVAIIGQDPYYQTTNQGEPRAIGLSFSLRPYDNVTVSLKNIYKELSATEPSFVTPDHGDLSAWCRQGVFLLNVCLTVKPGEAGSHQKVWLGFMSKLMDYLYNLNPNIIYVLWGRQAEELHGGIIDDGAKVVIAPHPAAREGQFIGSRTFLEIKRMLRNVGKSPIDWKLPTV